MSDKEYIEREAALLGIEEWAKTPCEFDYMWPLAFNSIRNIPAADVRPVVRAAWQLWEQDKPPCKWYSCDYCGFHALSKSNYCPNCGADMREES